MKLPKTTYPSRKTLLTHSSSKLHTKHPVSYTKQKNTKHTRKYENRNNNHESFRSSRSKSSLPFNRGFRESKWNRGINGYYGNFEALLDFNNSANSLGDGSGDRKSLRRILSDVFMPRRNSGKVEISKKLPKKRKAHNVYEPPAYATFDELNERRGERDSVVKPKIYWQSMMHHTRSKKCQRDSYHTIEPMEGLPEAEVSPTNNFKAMHRKFAPFAPLGLPVPSEESFTTSTESVFTSNSQSSLASMSQTISITRL